MAKIYKDTPEQFLKIAQKIDASKVDLTKLPQQIAEIEAKHIKPNVHIRTKKTEMVENPLIPQMVADVLNRYDWNSVNPVKRAIAKNVMEKKLKELGYIV